MRPASSGPDDGYMTRPYDIAIADSSAGGGTRAGALALPDQRDPVPGAPAGLSVVPPGWANGDSRPDCRAEVVGSRGNRKRVASKVAPARRAAARARRPAVPVAIPILAAKIGA